MSKTFKPDISWLTGPIMSIEHDYLKDKTMVIFKNPSGDQEYKLLEPGKDFKPFVYISKSKNYYNVIQHKQTIRAAKNESKSYGRHDSLFLLPETQFLIQAEESLYRDVLFDDFKIFTFDIETTGLDPENDRIIAIGIRCNQKMLDGEYTKFILHETESKILEEFCDVVVAENPDILAGHNVCTFDFPFIFKRMDIYGMPLEIGKFGMTAYTDFYTSKVHQLIEGSEFNQVRIPGRYVVDTMHLAQIEDTRRNEFESYGLKYLAQKLNVAPADRVYIDGPEIHKMLDEDPEKFMKYLTDDLDETYGLLRMFLPAYIQMSKLIPITLQNQIYAGATKKVGYLLCRDYYIAGSAVPKPKPKEDYEGAISEALEVGAFKQIAKFDVSSLYPSLIRYKNIVPKHDKLGAFLKYIIQFMDERLIYKRKAEDIESSKKAQDKKLYEEYYAYQLALKILINSFYGVLGNEHFIFNDYEAAGKVTEEGRKILMHIVNFLKTNQCKPISIDTDGVIFSYTNEVNPEEILKVLNSELDEGITVEFEKKFESILSYKAKNYVLLPYEYPEKDITVKGSAFRRRGLQPFLKKWIKESTIHLLKHDIDAYDDSIFLLKSTLAQRTLDLKEVLEYKKISYDYNAYVKRTSGNDINYFEAMRRQGKQKQFKSGDRVVYYCAGDEKTKKVSDMTKLYIEDEVDEIDYNSTYYIQLLDKRIASFKPFYDSIISQ